MTLRRHYKIPKQVSVCLKKWTLPAVIDDNRTAGWIPRFAKTYIRHLTFLSSENAGISFHREEVPKGKVMQIEKALINDCLLVSKVS